MCVKAPPNDIAVGVPVIEMLPVVANVTSFVIVPQTLKIIFPEPEGFEKVVMVLKPSLIVRELFPIFSIFE